MVKMLVIVMSVLVIHSVAMPVEALEVIDLKEAIQIALAQNPGLRAAQNGVEMSDQERKIAIGNFLPRLNVSQSIMYSDNPVFAFGTLLNQGKFSEADFNVDTLNNPDAITDHVSSIQLQQPVYNGGMEIIGYRASKVKQAKSLEELEQAEEEIIFRVVEGYYNVILAKEMWKLTKQSVETAEANLGLIRRMFDNGLVVKSDLLSAKVRLSHLQQQQVSAEYQSLLAVSALNTLMSVESTAYDVEDTFIFTSCPVHELSDLETLGVQQRSDLKILFKQREEATIGVDKARGAFLPAINLQFSYDYHGGNIFSDGSSSYVAAGSLTWNLFNGLSDRARYEQARKMEEMLDHRIQQLSDQIRLEIQQAFYNLQTSIDNLAVTEESIEQAEENLKIITNRYNQGVTTVIELLNAELLLSSARIDRIKALHGCSINLARMCKATGNIRERWEYFSDSNRFPDFFNNLENINTEKNQ